MEDENNKLIRYDGFDGFESGYETGDDDEGVHPLRGSLLAGTTRISFTNEAQWIEAVAKKILPTGFELLLVNVERVVICWEGQKAVQRVVGPGEKFPNKKKLNEGAPKSKWWKFGRPIPSATRPVLSGRKDARRGRSTGAKRSKKVEERPLTQEMNDSIPFKHG